MKYIIEFEDVPSFSEEGQVFYRCMQMPWHYISESNISRLTPYKEHPEEGKSFVFSERLNEALARFWDKSNHEFAEACDVTDATMSRYLSGGRIPKAPVIAAMAKALKVHADYLLGLEDEP